MIHFRRLWHELHNFYVIHFTIWEKFLLTFRRAYGNKNQESVMVDYVRRSLFFDTSRIHTSWRFNQPRTKSMHDLQPKSQIFTDMSSDWCYAAFFLQSANIGSSAKLLHNSKNIRIKNLLPVKVSSALCMKDIWTLSESLEMNKFVKFDDKKRGTTFKFVR